MMNGVDWKLLFVYVLGSMLVGLFGAFIAWGVVGFLGSIGALPQYSNTLVTAMATAFFMTFLLIFVILCIARAPKGD